MGDEFATRRIFFILLDLLIHHSLEKSVQLIFLLSQEKQETLDESGVFMVDVSCTGNVYFHRQRQPCHFSWKFIEAAEQ